jgi:5-methylcytosine-specific restriction endonuclease McrA
MPPGWKTTRLRILERDQYRCQIAGPTCTTTATAVDHVVAACDGGSEADTNLQSVCSPCHNRKTAAEAVAHQPRRKRPERKHPGLL